MRLTFSRSLQYRAYQIKLKSNARTNILCPAGAFSHTSRRIRVCVKGEGGVYKTPGANSFTFAEQERTISPSRAPTWSNVSTSSAASNSMQASYIPQYLRNAITSAYNIHVSVSARVPATFQITRITILRAARCTHMETRPARFR